MWSILALKYKVDNQRERVSNYPKDFHELNQGDMQFPKKVKEVPTFERLDNLRKLLELSSNDKILSPKCINKNYYEEQIYLLHYENHYCFITNLHNFCRNNADYKKLWKRCLKTCGNQTKHDEHK